ncbi:unnamed protein product [Polarella glacialis]|uniref:Hexosyltransferase n=1 Tax=Polarella glacialis TaxID=89957 RepID=A0A813JY40_POLGL|nr:unnamed protein product [Polarella glacialis]
MASNPLCSAFLHVACLLCFLHAAWCKEDVAACDEESILQLIAQKNDFKGQSPMSTNDNNTATAMVQTDAHLSLLNSEGAAMAAWKDVQRQGLSNQNNKEGSSPDIQVPANGGKARLGIHPGGSDDEPVSLVQHVPSVPMFEQQWHKMYQKDTQAHGGTPMSADTKLVIAVFSRREDGAFRDVIRKTWMNQSGACALAKGIKPDCSVYVTFAIAGGSKEVKFDEDMLVLDTPENMNDGKSFHYFQASSKMFPWATHIAKCDMDVYPYLRSIVRNIESPPDGTPTGCEAFLGRPMSHDECGGAKWCPRKGCKFRQNDFLKYGEKQGGCWNYMSGGLYIMTRSLASAISGPTGWWAHNSHGIEDLTAGRAVTYYAREHHVCVHSWTPGDWYRSAR